MNDVLDQFISNKENDYKTYLKIIGEMMSSGRYSYAEQTLVDIYEWVDEHETITDNQKDAIQNIKNKPRNSYARY